MSKTNAMVETVARAICLSGGTNPDAVLLVPGPSIPYWRRYEPQARAAIAAMEGMLTDLEGAGQFSSWSTADMSAQCRMQARLNLDPELTAFMNAVADRLAALAKVASPD